MKSFVLALSLVFLDACASRDVRCDGHLEQINASAPAHAPSISKKGMP